MKINKAFFRYLKLVTQYGYIGHCVFEYIGDIVTCSGPSMEPTLRTNDLLITDRIRRRIHSFDRGDIVIAKCPKEPTTFICKRIVGLPGDKIEIMPRFTWNPFSSSKSIITVDENGNVIEASDVCESDLDENQINNQTSLQRTFRSRLIYVPKGHVWLQGDNAENSLDSRNYGPVPMGLIQSRLQLESGRSKIFNFFQIRNLSDELSYRS